MTILALEFSSRQRSVAVLRPNFRTDELHESLTFQTKAEKGTRVNRPSDAIFEVVETGGPGTNAFAMIEQVLAGAGIEREQIDVMAVGLGPGSYTGIRAAISLAQGWQLARGMKLAGISSAEAIAAQARTERILGRVSVVIDAQRNELYLASYEIAPDGWRETVPLKIVSPAEAQSQAGADGILIGPEVTRWFPGGRLVFPRAAALAELAGRRSVFTPGEMLEPIYLRETNYVKTSAIRRILF